MKTWITLIALLWAPMILAQTASPQTPREYFDVAARHFLEGEKKQAIQTLHNGLKAHPDNASMQKLAEELLKEMEQQQQEQQQQQQEQQDQQQEQENQGEQDPQDNGDKGDEKKDPSNEENGDPSQGEEKDGSEERNEPNENGNPSSPQPGSEPGDSLSMSFEEAARLLNWLGQQDEETMRRVARALREQKQKSSPKPKSDKDW